MASFVKKAPFGIVPYDMFLRRVGAARLDEFQYQPRAAARSRSAFVAMQDHLDRLYRGVEAVTSFEDAAGQVFDCVPMELQPGLQNARGPLPTPPDMSRAPVMPRLGSTQPQAPYVPPLEYDRHGNPRRAPPGTVPVRRVTLEEMTRFPDLNAFLRKHPRRSAQTLRGEIPSTPSNDTGQNHRYSVGTQSVSNIGGTSYISLHQPPVNSHEIFSLAQQWYSAGSGSGLQTVEVGWQVFPMKYGNSSPNLFIYYTPDGYSSGSYNLDSPNTFVQLHNTYTIGGALSPVSVPGGAQRSLLVGVYKWGNAWWIYLNGFTNDNLLGYYPTSLFGSGGMTSAADTIDYGGETVANTPPDGDWGPMGSGANASSGWPQAAFHCYIYYWTPDGSARWANLSQISPSACYGFAGGFDTTYWGTYFFFGGPGGGNC